MTNKLVIGQHVRISGNFTWAQSQVAVVAYPPESIASLGYDEVGYVRTVHGEKGPVRLVYVKFETPQFDGDGDGPYRGTEIPEKYLTPI